jgi:hypothetical protein
MRIEPVGELQPDEDIPEDLMIEGVTVPCLPGQDVRIVFDSLAEDKTLAPDYEKALQAFFRLTEEDVRQAAVYIFALYKALMSSLEEDEIEIRLEKPEEVWNHVEAHEIAVTRRDKDGRTYVAIHAGADWDEEHGMTIVFRDGKTLSRVDLDDGHVSNADASGRGDGEDPISTYMKFVSSP